YIYFLMNCHNHRQFQDRFSGHRLHRQLQKTLQYNSSPVILTGNFKWLPMHVSQWKEREKDNSSRRQNN
ncbi:hypothetical protein L9F63_021386, partial [Diploptera punctata]